MGGLQKEHILAELRDYHTGEFPEISSSELVDKLREELSELEDEVIGSVLSTVNGKAVLDDYSEKLDVFLNRAIESTITEPEAPQIKQFFTSKVEHLKRILSLAAGGDFPLRKQRPARISLATKTIQVKK